MPKGSTCPSSAPVCLGVVNKVVCLCLVWPTLFKPSIWWDGLQTKHSPQSGESNLDFGALIIRLGFSLVFQETHIYVASWKNAADSTSGGLSLLLHHGNTYSICSSICSQQHQWPALMWLKADPLCTDFQSLLIFLLRRPGDNWRYLK